MTQHQDLARTLRGLGRDAVRVVMFFYAYVWYMLFIYINTATYCCMIGSSTQEGYHQSFHVFYVSHALKYLCAESATSSLLFFLAYEISQCRTTDSRAFLAPVVQCGVLTLWTVFIEQGGPEQWQSQPPERGRESRFGRKETVKNRCFPFLSLSHVIFA